MSEISLLPITDLTLTPFAPLVHVQPNIALLPSAALLLVPNVGKAMTGSDWPASLQQYFLSDGNYAETPFPVTQETGTDSGIQKTRKRFTGKFTFYSGTVWLVDTTDYDTFMDFYRGEADQGNDYFDMPIPSSSTALSVRFVPGSLSIIPDGGIGWRATFQLVQQPQAL